jgi:hypothetical protein
MKKLFPAVPVLLLIFTGSVSGQWIYTLQDLVCHSSCILVVERLDPPVTEHAYNCWVGLFHHRAYHETIHHFRVLEVLLGNRYMLEKKAKNSRIDVHKAYTHSWWSMQKENPKIHGTLIEYRYSPGKKEPGGEKHIVFLQTWGDRFEYAAHKAFESIEKRDEVVKIIAQRYGRNK